MKGLKTGGRQLGTPNKTTLTARQILLEELNLDPLKALARLAMRSEESGELNIAFGCYKELMKYCHQQLKAVEHSGEVLTQHEQQPVIVTFIDRKPE